MTQEQLYAIIEQGEGEQIEFKQSANKDIAHEVCAFANTKGGTLLIGVADDGSVVGCELNNAKASQLQNTLDKIQPSLDLQIEQIPFDDKTVVCVSCPPPAGERKVFMVSGQIFVRRGPNAQKLTSPEEVARFMQLTNVIHFDQKPATTFTYPNDFSEQYYSQFLELSETTTNGLDPLTVLTNLGLVTTDNTFLNAALLLLARDLQAFFDHARIRVLQFRGIDKVNIMNEQPISGTIYQQYHSCIQYLRTILNTSYIIEDAGQRKEVLEIPEVVLREALLNALAHRDYYESGATIMVEIYEDRIEISNPGGLVPSIDPSEFGKRSLSRNPLLFKMLQRMRLVEQVGSGIGRMRHAMASQGLQEPQFSFDGMFVVKLYRPLEFEDWIRKWESRLNNTQMAILKIIAGDPTATIKVLSQELEISSTAIDKNLTKMKKLGLIKRVGSPRSGHWEIKQVLE